MADDRRYAMGSTAACGLSLFLLGGFRVEVGGRPVPDTAWQLRKGRSVLALLALSPGYRLARDRVLDQIWPELDTAAAVNNLHYVLHHVRRILGSGAGHGPRVRRGIVELGLGIPILVDVERFTAAARRARDTRIPIDYRAAVAIYTGDLLPADDLEDWAAGQREQLRSLYLAMLSELAQLLEAEGALDEAAATLERLLAAAPDQERAAVSLMRVYALLRRRPQALRQYERLRGILHAELSVEPDPFSQRLYRDILTGRFPADEHSPAILPATQATPSAGGLRTNLAEHPTSFIGREQELASLRAELATARVLTLVGPGGSGKSRLAQRAVSAGDGPDPAVDEVWLIELATVTDPDLVTQTLAATLGLAEQPGQPLVETLVDALRDRRVLLLLDNCEQVAVACAGLAERLIGACPYLQLLATSRLPLQAAGETIWRVSPLSLPPPEKPRRRGVTATPAQLLSYDALRLFVERARLARPGFRLTAENMGAVAAICRRLDGLPLAIELAAARLAVLGPDQIADRLDDPFRLLEDAVAGRDAPRRTLRSAIAWSYGLLDGAERRLFRRLAVFAGAFSLEAAEAAGAAEVLPEDQVLSALARLVERSLVNVEARRGEARYRMLETIRAFAVEQPDAACDLRDARCRLARHYATLAARAEEELTGPQQEWWLQRLADEWPTIRLLLGWLVEQDDAGTALCIAAALWRFCELRGLLTEGRHWLAAGLALRSAGQAPVGVRARALNGAGNLARTQGDAGRAEELHSACLALRRAHGDTRGCAASLNNLGIVADDLGEYELARERHAESLALFRELGDEWHVANSLHNAGIVERHLGQYEQAERLHEEALVTWRRLGDKAGTARALGALGEVALERGQLPRAATLFEASLELRRELRDRPGIALTLFHLAIVALQDGDAGGAGALGARALRAAWELGDRRRLFDCVELLGRVALVQGDHVLAVRLLSAASLIAASLAQAGAPDASQREQEVAVLRHRLGEEQFAAAWAAGQALSIEQVIARAAAGPTPAAAPHSS